MKNLKKKKIKSLHNIFKKILMINNKVKKKKMKIKRNKMILQRKIIMNNNKVKKMKMKIKSNNRMNIINIVQIKMSKNNSKMSKKNSKMINY